jgi:hypothetical protein
MFWRWCVFESKNLHRLNGVVNLTALLPGKDPPGTHRIADWMGPRTHADDMEKWQFLPLLGLDHPSLCQSLYRLLHLSTEVANTQSKNNFRKCTADYLDGKMIFIVTEIYPVIRLIGYGVWTIRHRSQEDKEVSLVEESDWVVQSNL